MPRERTPRKWQPREMQLLNEWLAANYADAVVMTRIRLGTLPDVETRTDLTYQQQRSIGVWRRWADAIVITQRMLRVVEAKIRPDAGVVSQLKLYLRLVPHTPELEPYLSRPRKGVIVYAVEDPQIRELAKEEGFELHYFRPDWIEPYLAELYPRV